MPTIVVIEEDNLMRGLLVEWLTAAGYAVRALAPEDIETSGAAADLVIVDVYMPRSEGAQRLGAVKSAYGNTPVIAISGQFRSGSQGFCTAAQALGVQQVVAKPFSRLDLLEAVRSAISPSA